MGVQFHACIGETNVWEDIKRLKYGVHVIVWFPRGINDIMKQKFKTDYLRLFVIDEADEMM
jgi:translation initiation factor 4A